MGDRNRTCIIRICNPLPHHSVAHPHGGKYRTRTYGSAFTNLMFSKHLQSPLCQLSILKHTHTSVHYTSSMCGTNTLQYGGRRRSRTPSGFIQNPVFKAGRSPSPLHHLPLVGISGIEPKLSESKSLVLPLHYIPIELHKFLKSVLLIQNKTV